MQVAPLLSIAVLPGPLLAVLSADVLSAALDPPAEKKDACNCLPAAYAL